MEIGEFAARLTSLADLIHQLHLGTRSYAQHKALSFYVDVRDFVDDFTETWQGQFGQVDFDMVHVDPGPHSDPVGAVNAVCTALAQAKAELADDMAEHGHLVNMIEDLTAKAYHTLYKLKFLS